MRQSARSAALLPAAFFLALGIGAAPINRVPVVSSQGKTQPRLIISVNGTQVGESTYVSNPDGSFDSESSLSIGSVKLSSSIKGHIQHGRLIDYVSKTEAPGQHIELRLSKGTLTAGLNGKTKTMPFNDKTGLLAANLGPELWTSTLLDAEKSIQSNPASRTVELKAYFLDLGATIPAKIEEESDRKIQVKGENKAAKLFVVTLNNTAVNVALDDSGHVVGFEVPSQKLRLVEEGWDALYEDPLAKFPELSQATFKVKAEKGVTMKTRDGVSLVCDVIRPDDDLKHPAILVRTPYGRGTEAVNGSFFAARGYAFVAQDCRGREDSGGEWDPFVNEGKDGYDTIQWIAAQPWCDGNVGMIGGSYDGYVQWAAAVEKPPALKCIIPQVSPPDAMRNIPYDHGVFALYLDLWWAKIVAGRKTDFSGLNQALPHVTKLDTLPLNKADSAVLGTKLDFYQKWLKRPKISDWSGWDFTYHLDQATVPALHISGIWDGDEIGTHINWSTMRALGRTNQWIVFGPWTHAFDTTRSVGDVDYGPNAIIDLDSLYVRWFDTWLKGKDAGMSKVPHVRLFVTGANKWITLPDWPASTMKPSVAYLAGSHLAAERGNYRTRSYVYDPAKDKQVPQVLETMDRSSATTRMNLAAERKRGALVFQSAPFKKATALTSPFSVHLYFRCSAENTDFYAYLLDVDANGKARLLGMGGKIRASYLGGMDSIKALVPGRAYEASIIPWDFAHEFAKGHRLGLVIASTGFPIFSRNLGYLDPIGTGTRMQKQRNTILMDKSHPSSLSYYVLW